MEVRVPAAPLNGKTPFKPDPSPQDFPCTGQPIFSILFPQAGFDQESLFGRRCHGNPPGDSRLQPAFSWRFRFCAKQLGTSMTKRFSDHRTVARATSFSAFVQTTRMTTKERLFSIDDMCTRLGVNKDSVYRWIAEKGFPAHHVGRLLRFKLSEVDEWVPQGGRRDEPEKQGGGR